MVKATVSPPGSSSVKHTIEGQWHIQTKNTKTGKVFTDVTTPKEEVTVGPTEEMGEFESRKLWSLVSHGIKEGDYETASREKSKIEVRRHPIAPFDTLISYCRTTNARKGRTRLRQVQLGR